MKWRRSIQIIFLALFVFLIIQGKQQIWILLFLAGLAGALWWGRFYCAWLCPINTTMEIVDGIYRRIGIERLPIPDWVKNKWVRVTMVLIFIATMLSILLTGKKIPVLLLWIIIGTGLSLFFVPALWHRYLCPYGAILNLTGSQARNSFVVDEENCIRCKKCSLVCPAGAIIKENPRDYPFIDKGLCLVCTQCTQVCPKDTIKYGRQQSFTHNVNSHSHSTVN